MRRVGTRAAMIPVTMKLTSERGLRRDLKFGIVHDQLLTPLYGYVSVLNALIAYERQAGASTFAIRGAVNVEGQPSIAFDDVASIPLYQPSAYVATQKRISGYRYWFHRQMDYRGLVKVQNGATDCKSNVVCDALILDPQSRSDTYPYIEINEQDVTIGHEASVSKVGEEQVFYLMSRGLTENEATNLIVQGFLEVFTKELPMEYAIEFNRLVKLEMEGSLG